MPPTLLGVGINVTRLGIGGNSMSLLFTLTVEGNDLIASGLGLTLNGNDLEVI